MRSEVRRGGVKSAAGGAIPAPGFLSGKRGTAVIAASTHARDMSKTTLSKTTRHSRLRSPASHASRASVPAFRALLKKNTKCTLLFSQPCFGGFACRFPELPAKVQCCWRRMRHAGIRPEQIRTSHAPLAAWTYRPDCFRSRPWLRWDVAGLWRGGRKPVDGD